MFLRAPETHSRSFTKAVTCSILGSIDTFVISYFITGRLVFAALSLGVAVLALAFYLARLGELRTLNWLLSTLLPYVVFALIVVFQSEIRHALANLGSRVSLMRSSSSAAFISRLIGPEGAVARPRPEGSPTLAALEQEAQRRGFLERMLEQNRAAEASADHP